MARLTPDEKYEILENVFEEKGISAAELDKAVIQFAESLVQAYRVVKAKEKRPRHKKKKVSGFAQLINKHIGAGYELYHRPLNRINMFWVLDKLSKEKKSIQVGKKGFIDTDKNFKFHAGRQFAAEYLNLDGEKLTIDYKPGFIIPKIKAAYMATYNAMGEFGIAVIAQKEDLHTAIDWFDDYVKSNSIFKGRLVTVTTEAIKIHTPKDEDASDWNNIVPNADAREEFHQIVDMVGGPEKYRKAGLTLKRGVLMTGPPGTGKTVHVKCLVNDIIKVGGSVIIVEGLSDYNWSLTEVYEIAKTLQPAVIIIEDIDTLTHNRDDEGSLSPMSVLQDLIAILDGATALDGVITLATSNYKDRLDRALASRPGRFDVIYTFGFPEKEIKYQILDKYLTKLNIKESQDSLLLIPEVKELIEGDYTSGAHIAEFCAGIIRGQLFNSKESVATIASRVATQLLTVSAADAAAPKVPGSFGFGTS